MKFSTRQKLLSAIRRKLTTLRSGEIVWGRNVYLGPNSTVSGVNYLSIGDNVYIGKNVTIEIQGSIGDGCIIANNVGIIGRKDHDPCFSGDMFFAPQARQVDALRQETVIENGVWIGYGAIVMSGVRVGARSIISAGAIVTRDVPANSLVRMLNEIAPRRVRAAQLPEGPSDGIH